MKLYYFTEESLNYFKANVKRNVQNYQSYDNSWIIEKKADAFCYWKDIEDFELYVDMDDLNKMDCENAKRLYIALKFMSDTQATDERIWAGLCHSTFYDFIKKRWSSAREYNNMKKTSIIISRYFFGQNSPLFRNTIAKLWWLGRLTYDETNQKNPFFLLDTLASHDLSTRVTDLFTSSYSRNKHVLKCLLEVIAEFEETGIMIDENIYRSIVQYLNIYAGKNLIDYIPKDKLKVEIRNKINYYRQYGPSVIKNNKVKQMLYIDDMADIEAGNMRRRVRVTPNNATVFLERKAGDEVYYDDCNWKITCVYKKK